MAKVLLVEDDKSLREIYGVRLLAEGYDIVSAGDGEEALAVAIRERPDLIISDVMMPKISGFEMLDLLRGNDATKNIKVIMMTALSSDTQRERGESLGADRYLVKSQVGIEDVVRTVHEVLGDRDGQGQTAAQAVQATNSGPAPDSSSQNQSSPEDSAAAVSVFQATSITPPTPAPNQSPVNPPAATAPNEVAGVPAPIMPAEPLSVPPVATPPSEAPSLPPVAPPSDDSSDSVQPVTPASSDDSTTSADTSSTAISAPDDSTEKKEVPSFQPKDSNDADNKPIGEENKPSVDLTQSGAGLGTRVIQPIGEGVSPKVNLENLLANEEARSMGLDPSNLVDNSEASGDSVTVKTAETAAADSPPLDEVDAHSQLVEAAEAAIPPVGDNSTIVFPSQQ
ncbi:response regulator [Candidatus Saccharibacteria bacterium]|nr:response regulator [Candidatus Saccharibacteria bacterium]